MNEVIKAISDRYTARAFSGAVSIEDLQVVAEAGIASPSAYNKQQWQIVVITDHGLINELEVEGLENLKNNPATRAQYERIISRGGKLFYGASAVIVIAIPESDSEDSVASALLDCGIVVENMALAAHSLGLGNCICGLAKLAFSGENAQYFKQRLGFKESWNFGISLLLGVADLNSESGCPRKRTLDNSKITYV
ncbi:MAG: nitroreductase family protein [Candidatus Ancillula sp.]|jgi:nitroreductase|nr:nitroreductase family protein [Candidatus Ancillula sp.]